MLQRPSASGHESCLDTLVISDSVGSPQIQREPPPLEHTHTHVPQSWGLQLPICSRVCVFMDTPPSFMSGSTQASQAV